MVIWCDAPLPPLSPFLARLMALLWGEAIR